MNREWLVSATGYKFVQWSCCGLVWQLIPSRKFPERWKTLDDPPICPRCERIEGDIMIDGFHRPEYEWLSNFWELRPAYLVALRNPVTGLRLEYRTTEHAYQAAKTLDDEQRKAIQAARYAGIAKKMGSPAGYKGFQITLREDWTEANRLILMEALLRGKIKDPDLVERLLATADEHIQESNWWGDDFWGVVTQQGYRPCRPFGQNHLGKLWMKIRKEKRDGIK